MYDGPSKASKVSLLKNQQLYSDNLTKVLIVYN